MYKKVKAILHGTVALSTGITHFDPKNDAEDGRYQTRILSDADVVLAERRKLVKVVGDATQKEFDAQQAGFASTGRVREFGEKAAEEGSKLEEESSAGLGGGAAVATAGLRAFPAGQGPDAVQTGDPDAAPVPGAGGAASSGGAPAAKTDGKAGGQKVELPAELKQAADKVIEAVKGIDDAAKLDELDKAEKGRGDKARSTVTDAIAARKAELAK